MNVNIIQKWADANKTIAMSKNICVLIRQFAISKNTMCWFRPWVKCKPISTYLTTHAICLFLSFLLILSFYPLCLIPIMFHLSSFYIKSAWSFCMIIIDWQYMSEDAPVVSLGTCLKYNLKFGYCILDVYAMTIIKNLKARIVSYPILMHWIYV